MIFFRTQKGPVDRPVGFVRAASFGALTAYPAGALILALTDDNLAASLAGYGLILAALVCAALLIGTSTQRIVAEETTVLDEYELQMRFRAMGTAYGIFTLLGLCAVIYAAIASDFGGWVPSSYDHYNGLFWGIFLYASVLPTACLAWLIDASPEQGA